MTELQKQISSCLQLGKTSIKDIALILEKPEHSISVSVGKMAGYCIIDGEVQADPGTKALLARIQELEAQVAGEQLPKIVNLTNHPVTISRPEEGYKEVFQPSGIICRINQTYDDREMYGVPVKVIGTDSVTNYPDQPNEIYIVSGIVGDYLYLNGYTNFIMPDMKTAKFINKKCVSVRGFWKPAHD